MQNTGVKWGIIGGVTLILIGLLTYVISPNTYLTTAKWLGFVAILVILYMAGKEEREKHGGYITFQELLRPIFLTYVIIAVFSVIEQYLMLRVVDPGMVDTLKQMSMEGMEKMKSFIGEDAYEKAMEEMEKNEFAPTLRTSALTLAVSIIIGFIISAIYAAVMKRKNPELA